MQAVIYLITIQGNQSRPRIFDLEIKRPELLYAAVVEVDERVRVVTEDAGDVNLESMHRS